MGGGTDFAAVTELNTMGNSVGVAHKIGGANFLFRHWTTGKLSSLVLKLSLLGWATLLVAAVFSGNALEGVADSGMRQNAIRYWLISSVSPLRNTRHWSCQVDVIFPTMLLATCCTIVGPEAGILQPRKYAQHSFLASQHRAEVVRSLILNRTQTCQVGFAALTSRAIVTSSQGAQRSRPLRSFIVLRRIRYVLVMHVGAGRE